MFVGALFTVAKRQKQCKCQPSDEWRSKTVYPHNGILKRNVLIHATLWTNLEDFYASLKKKKTVWKNQMLYDSFYMICPE